MSFPTCNTRLMYSNKKNNIYWICATIAKHAHSDSAASTARIKQQRSLPSE